MTPRVYRKQGRPAKKANPLFAGYCKCLGWCNKKMYSSDKRRYRYCEKCSARKILEENKMSRVEKKIITD